MKFPHNITIYWAQFLPHKLSLTSRFNRQTTFYLVSSKVKNICIFMWWKILQIRKKNPEIRWFGGPGLHQAPRRRRVHEGQGQQRPDPGRKGSLSLVLPEEPRSRWGRGGSASAPDAPSQTPSARPPRPFAAVPADAKGCRAARRD